MYFINNKGQYSNFTCRGKMVIWVIIGEGENERVGALHCGQFKFKNHKDMLLLYLIISGNF